MLSDTEKELGKLILATKFYEVLLSKPAIFGDRSSKYQSAEAKLRNGGMESKNSDNNKKFTL